MALYLSYAAFAAYVPMAILILKSTLHVTTLGASGAVSGLLATLLVLHEGYEKRVTGRAYQANSTSRTAITLPMLPPEWTRGIDTGVLLGIIILYEIYGIRKRGIAPPRALNGETRRPSVDHMGHLAGYTAGIGGGFIVRSNDPKWRDIERHHFLTRDFGKATEPSMPISLSSN